MPKTEIKDLKITEINDLKNLLNTKTPMILCIVGVSFFYIKFYIK